VIFTSDHGEMPGSQSMREKSALREFDPTDPVKYDFALFGIGVNEKI